MEEWWARGGGHHLEEVRALAHLQQGVHQLREEQPRFQPLLQLGGVEVQVGWREQVLGRQGHGRQPDQVGPVDEPALYLPHLGRRQQAGQELGLQDAVYIK